jgi:hypothetical protein
MHERSRTGLDRHHRYSSRTTVHKFAVGIPPNMCIIESAEKGAKESNPTRLDVCLVLLKSQVIE